MNETEPQNETTAGECNARSSDLLGVRARLKTGEYDGTDIMLAWLAIDELIELRAFTEAAFQAHPNLDRDVELITSNGGYK